MFEVTLTGLAWCEVVALAGLLALGYLSIVIPIGVSVAYFATREPRALRLPAPAQAAQTTGAIPARAGVIGAAH